MSDVRLSQVIGPAFFDMAHDVFRHGHTHYDLSGGRGSLKSSAVSLVVPPLLIANPGTHALVLRKVANTIRDSVYAQYLWAIGELGLASYWEAKVQPMELIYRPTGQKIMFRGADDPMKIKSIKVPFGYIAVTHFEEKDQFAGRAEIRNILQSTMRGGSKFWNFESYNPPISRDNWANKDSLDDRPDRMCCKSTYLEAPPEWLGDQFLAEAEHLKEKDERAYRHEYLGEAIGTGGNVFENVTKREITDAEIVRFDRIYQGIDWGYFPDPFHFGRMHYDSTQRRLYIFGEYRDWKKGNRQTFDKLHELFPDADSHWTTADSGNSDNNKSNADYQSWGMRKLMGAAKGPGSVEAGCKWLQTLTEIIIDPKRCPHTVKEFLAYEYERNKDGEIISGYPDRDNHSIDMVRYALERVWMRRGK